MQAVVAFPSLVTALVVRGDTATGDSLTTIVHAVAHPRGTANRLVAAAIELGLWVLHGLLPMCKNF